MQIITVRIYLDSYSCNCISRFNYLWIIHLEDIMNVDEDEDPMVVELYAQQFNWKARYAGADNVWVKLTLD